ncbi:MAG: putative glycoside hydrolase [Oscillospiraceae bacterium]
MARQRKIIRTKAIYKKRRIPQNALSRILFVFLILILIGIGFIVMREWSARFGKNAKKINPSSNPPSSIQSSSVPESSETLSSTSEVAEQKIIGKTANISAKTLLDSKGNISQELARLKAEGYTTVALELKAENGMIAYQSANEMAVKYGAISENAVDLSATLKAITDAELIPVARISTLKDAKAPHVSNENSYAFSTSLATNWLDNSVDKGGKPWLNPYMDNTKKYICDITKEISDIGFKTIVLENVMFPDKNTFKMNTIKTTPERPAMLNQFVSEVQAAVPNANVIRSIDVVSTVINSENGFESVINTITSKDVALIINLDAIEMKKEQICIKSAIVDQNGYDKNITAAVVAGNLIAQAKTKAEGNIIPIVSAKDFALLEQVFKDEKISNYIVI